jgi:hypothetical protein
MRQRLLVAHLSTEPVPVGSAVGPRRKA